MMKDQKGARHYFEDPSFELVDVSRESGLLSFVHNLEHKLSNSKHQLRQLCQCGVDARPLCEISTYLVHGTDRMLFTSCSENIRTRESSLRPALSESLCQKSVWPLRGMSQAFSRHLRLRRCCNGGILESNRSMNSSLEVSKTRKSDEFSSFMKIRERRNICVSISLEGLIDSSREMDLSMATGHTSSHFSRHLAMTFSYTWFVIAIDSEVPGVASPIGCPKVAIRHRQSGQGNKLGCISLA